MLLSPVADRLKGQVTTLRNNVSGAADFASGKEGVKSVPASFVIPLMDRAVPAQTQDFGSVLQHVSERFGVVLVVSNMRDATGGNAHGDLQPLRDAVIAALLGWQPAAEYDPIEYGGGRMLALSGSDLWWQLEFVTGYYLKGQQ